MPPIKPLPKYITQIEGTTPNADCGPVSAAILVDYASKGAVRTKQGEVREKMGAPPTGFTNLNQAKIAIGKFQKRFEKKGLRAPVANYHPDRPFTRLIETLENGRAAQVGILYGVVKDLRPEFYSINDFTGRHFVTVMEDPDSDQARPTVLVYDPLANGRKLANGRRTKKGPQSWPRSLLMNAADAYVQDIPGPQAAQHTINGVALASWVSVTRVKAADGGAPDDPDTPEPGDLPTLRERIKELKKQVRDLTKAVDERDERIISLESGLVDIGTLTAAVAAAQLNLEQIVSTVDKLIPAGDPFEPDEDSAEANSADGANPDDEDHL